MSMITDWIDRISTAFEYDNIQRAMIVGILIALCSSLLGVTLVLKRFSFIGDGLSHVAFGLIAIAIPFNLTHEFYLVLPGTIFCAMILLSMGQNAKIKGDAAVAMMSVSSLALGYLIMNKFPGSSNISGDVCSTLFGSLSIITLTKADVKLCIILSILVIAIFLVFYNKIFAVTFDEDFATATGTKAKLYTVILAITVAIVIVLAMDLVGSLLVSALIIFPSLSAMRVFKTFKSVILCSAVIAVICSSMGILVTIIAATPVGSTIVGINLLCFLLFSGVSFVKRGA